MKSTKFAILLVVLLLGGFTWNGYIDKKDNIMLSVQASDNTSKAKKAYKTFLEKIANKGEYEGAAVTSTDITFYIKDLTGDGVPEMLICQNMTYPSEQAVYTYRKGKVKKLKSMNWYSGGELQTLYPKKHVMKALQSDDTGKTVVYYYKITKTKVTVAVKGIGNMDDSGRVVLSKYYCNGKKTTKQKYSSYVRGLNKSKKLSVTNGKDVVFHSNTEGNRGKYLTNKKQGKLKAPKMGKWKKIYDSLYDTREFHGTGVTYQIKWDAVKGADGYEVYDYERESSFEKLKLIEKVDVKKKKKYEISFSSMYQFKVKVRAYQLIDGKKVYGSWSKEVMQTITYD